METYTLRENNLFNWIRIIAAYMVIFAHSFAIQEYGRDPIASITPATHTGQLAVYIFTFLSGVFITKSICSTNCVDFLKKRVVRLYPELVVCLLFCIAVGAFFTTLPIEEYFKHGQVWNYFSANILNVANEHELPGVFGSHRYRGLNGVLWFITFEVRIYLLYFILKICGVFNKVEVSNIVFLILVMWVFVYPSTFPILGSNSTIYGMVDFPQYTITFFFASLVYINVKSCTVTFSHVLLAFWLVYLCRNTSIAMMIWGLGAIVVAMYIGMKNCHLIRCQDLRVDVSYGVFLYGWPIGQIIRELYPSWTSYSAALLTAILATIAGYVSYRLSVVVAKLL